MEVFANKEFFTPKTPIEKPEKVKPIKQAAPAKEPPAEQPAKKDEQKNNFCSKCGAKVGEGEKFCGECGEKM